MESNTTISVETSDVKHAKRYFFWRFAAASLGLISLVALCSIWGFSGPSQALFAVVPFLLIGIAAITMSTTEILMVLVFANKIKGRQLGAMKWVLHILVLSSGVFYAYGGHDVLPKSIAILGMAITGFTYFAIAITICLFALKNIDLAAASNKLLVRQNASK